ncbi:MAG: amidohydrolase family protein, partial [Nocardioidaceae bacterium]
MPTKLIIRGGTVITMDPSLGTLPKADMLVEDDTIVAIEPKIDADAEVIDATGDIVIPGFVDT